MMPKSLKLVSRNSQAAFRRLFGQEEGVSLVEVLVGIAIAAGIAAFLGTAVWQFFTVTRWGNSQMLAASDHQTAILWLGRDSSEAASFTAGTGQEYGTFAWPGGDPSFRYRYDNGNGTLVRDEISGGSVQSSQVVMRYVAQQSDVSFSQSGSQVTVDLLTTQGSETFTTTLVLTMRVQ